MRKAKALYSGYSKGVVHHHLNFGRDSKVGRGMGKLYPRHSRRFRCALTGGCGHEEGGDGLTRHGGSVWLVSGACLTFPAWP